MKKLSFTVNLKKRLDTTFQPPWSSIVERWYQLDELSFAFCEALHEWKNLESFPRPDLILMGIEGASNVADQDFIANPVSPAKFVYTLPNIPAAVIFQMLKMNSQVFYLSHGKETLKILEQEAQIFSESGKKVWVFASRAQADSSSREIIFYCS